MNRRSFLKQSAGLAAMVAAGPDVLAQERTKTGVQYLPASETIAPLSRMEDFGRRAPFGWTVAGLPPADQGGSLTLRWSAPAVDRRPARLRICVLDTREPQNLLEVRLLGTDRVLGQFDLRWIAQFQIHEINLSAADAAELGRRGGVLRAVKGTLPVWIVTGGPGDPAVPDALKPHLLPEMPTDPMAEFHARMDSLACVQAFGWMEGCVLDGLQDLARLPGRSGVRDALRAHLGLFFKPDGQLIYEAPRGEPKDNRISGIEGTLPFAALAWEQPEHPAIDLAVKFWATRADADGCVQDQDATTTEGAYTVGYPMAVIARQRGDRRLAARAVEQVMIRQQRLFDGKTLGRIRQTKPDGKTSLSDRNWCRGVAWQFLGMARTLLALEGFIDTAAARSEFVRLAAWVQPWQLPGGLWSVFFDDPSLAPDTSGSAGIAAALALGVKQGWLDARAGTAARRTLDALRGYLTPDGFLGGASQSNKGGDSLQRSNYRVIYPMGMGLMAQLVAALESTSG